MTTGQPSEVRLSRGALEGVERVLGLPGLARPLGRSLGAIEPPLGLHALSEAGVLRATRDGGVEIRAPELVMAGLEMYCDVAVRVEASIGGRAVLTQFTAIGHRGGARPVPDTAGGSQLLTLFDQNQLPRRVALAAGLVDRPLASGTGLELSPGDAERIMEQLREGDAASAAVACARPDSLAFCRVLQSVEGLVRVLVIWADKGRPTRIHELRWIDGGANGLWALRLDYQRGIIHTAPVPADAIREALLRLTIPEGPLSGGGP